MNISRIERTAKQALETAEYVYNSRDVEFVEVLDRLDAEKPHTVTLWCTGSLDLEIAVYGEVCDIDVKLDDAAFATATGRIWRKEIENLGRTRHILTFTAASVATEVRLCIKAKGGLRI